MGKVNAPTTVHTYLHARNSRHMVSDHHDLGKQADVL